MTRTIAGAMVALGAVGAACGGGRPGATTANRPKAAAAVGNACDRKLLTAADAATVVPDAVTGTRAIAGGAQTCEFTTAAGSSVIVTLRPGTGRASLAVWKSGRMPISGTPLDGVGQEAVWIGPLDEVVAEENDLLCDIQVNGLAAVLRDRPAAAQRAIGALCNTIFSAVR